MKDCERSSAGESTPRGSNAESPTADGEKVIPPTDVEKGVPPDADLTVLSDGERQQPRDPNIVDWEGPDDPENPLNWPFRKKVVATVIIASITFVTPLGSSMFAPGVLQVMRDFHSDNLELTSFVISVYLLGYCFGPLLLAPMSELYGRLIVYNVCNVLYVVFTVACAVAPNLASLIVFRFFAGLAGSCPLTLGAGSIADMFIQEQRGAAMAAWAIGPLIGPVIGPVAGGYLTQAKGWRWTFWVIAMTAGAIVISTVTFMRESYAVTLLQRKTKRLQKETGNPNLRSALDTGRSPRDLFVFSIMRPSKMLFLSPIVFLLSLYVAVVYGYLYLLFTTMPALFQRQYGFTQGSVGLTYLGIGIGSMIGLGVLGSVSDRLLGYLSRKHGGAKKPEYRLPPAIPGTLFIPAALFMYGWSAQEKTHWIVPIIGTSFLGIGMLVIFMTISTYLVDAYTIYAASAMAANTVFRSLVGTVLPLAGGPMYKALGLGWGNSLLGFIALALAPLPVIFYIYGERIRKSTLFKVEF